ncbi:MAG: COP23 domain-containing protein [Cyanobacteria bacterium P01_G01_bin.39]
MKYFCHPRFVLVWIALIASIILGQTAKANENDFKCGFSDGEYATSVRTSRGWSPLVRWVHYTSAEWTPEKRCVTVTNRFQGLADNGWLNYIKGGEVNNLPVLCGVEATGEEYQCNDKNLLLTLSPGTDPDEARDRLLDTRAREKNIILDLSDDKKLTSFVDGETYVNFNMLKKIIEEHE